ncbi:MAG TPA: hypothetical protein VNQ56_00360 [Pseudolabrys sp.]|nr:hypothetical protein [Pseudolabrys sp.]
MHTRIEVAHRIFSTSQKLAELAYQVGMREAADYLEIAAASAYEVILNEGDIASGEIVASKPRRRR